MPALSHTPDCLGQAVAEISMSWVVFRARGVRFLVAGGGDPAEGMLLAGLTCKVDVSALRLARPVPAVFISNSNHSFHSPTQGGAYTLDSHPWFSVNLSSVSANGFGAVTCSLGLQSSTELTLGPLVNCITSEPTQ